MNPNGPVISNIQEFLNNTQKQTQSYLLSRNDRHAVYLWINTCGIGVTHKSIQLEATSGFPNDFKELILTKTSVTTDTSIQNKRTISDVGLKKRTKKRVQYTDLRNMFIRGLIDKETKWMKLGFVDHRCDQSRDIIGRLAVEPVEIRSAGIAKRITGVGKKFVGFLKDIQREENYPNHSVQNISAVTSFICVMHAFIREKSNNCGRNLKWSDKSCYISVGELFDGARGMTEEDIGPSQPPQNCPNNRKHDFYKNSPGWRRLRYLIKDGFVKQRNRIKRPAFELLETRKTDIERIVRLHSTRINADPKPSETTTETKTDPIQSNTTHDSDSDTCTIIQPQNLENIQSQPTLHNSLIDNIPDGYAGVVMLVDRREGGGSDSTLQEYCNMFQRYNIIFRTIQLPTGLGDYAFIYQRSNSYGAEFILPIIIERKTAVDLAGSMVSGRKYNPDTLSKSRFAKQKTAMLKTQVFFEREFNVNASLHYIIEGSLSNARNCVYPCEKMCVGVCGVNPSVDQTNQQIEIMKSDPHFSVHETTSRRGTMDVLSNLFTVLNTQYNNSNTSTMHERLQFQDFRNRLPHVLRFINVQVEFNTILDHESEEKSPIESGSNLVMLEGVNRAFNEMGGVDIPTAGQIFEVSQRLNTTDIDQIVSDIMDL